jgi:hypothetical protein
MNKLKEKFFVKAIKRQHTKTEEKITQLLIYNE